MISSHMVDILSNHRMSMKEAGSQSNNTVESAHRKPKGDKKENPLAEARRKPSNPLTSRRQTITK